MKQATWTLTAYSQSEWGIPVKLESFFQVKTRDIQKVADELYAKYSENDCYHDCHKVIPVREVAK